MAFLTLAFQGPGAIGRRGLLPAADFLESVAGAAGSRVAGFWQMPSILLLATLPELKCQPGDPAPPVLDEPVPRSPGLAALVRRDGQPGADYPGSCTWSGSCWSPIRRRCPCWRRPVRARPHVTSRRALPYGCRRGAGSVVAARAPGNVAAAAVARRPAAHGFLREWGGCRAGAVGSGVACLPLPLSASPGQRSPFAWRKRPIVSSVSSSMRVASRRADSSGRRFPAGGHVGAHEAGVKDHDGDAFACEVARQRDAGGVQRRLRHAVAIVAARAVVAIEPMPAGDQRDSIRAAAPDQRMRHAQGRHAFTCSCSTRRAGPGLEAVVAQNPSIQYQDVDGRLAEPPREPAASSRRR